MQVIIAAVVFGLIIAAIAILVIVNFTYKGLRQMREAVEDRQARKQKEKEQKDRNPFGEDYFKSSDDTSADSRRWQYRQQGQRTQQSRQGQTGAQTAQADANENTARRTTTSSGVTIIDDREDTDKKKIFSDGDGEYVEFEEVK